MDDPTTELSITSLSASRLTTRQQEVSLRTAYLELGFKGAGMMGLSGSLVGFIYLLMYCSYQHLPMPISFSQLPLLLLLLSVMGTLTSAASVVFVGLPLWHHFGVFGDGLQILAGKRDAPVKSRFKGQERYAAAAVVPSWLLFTWLCANPYLERPLWTAYTAAPVGLALLALIIGTVRKSTSIENLNRLYAPVCIQLIGFMALAFLVAYLLLQCLYRFDPHPSVDAEFMTIESGSAAVLIGMLWSAPKGNTFRLDSRAALIPALLLVAVPPLCAPIAVPVSTFSLSVLRAGGGFETKFVLKPETVSIIPQQLVDTPSAKVVESVPLLVGMVVGDDYWVHPKAAQSGRWFELRKELTVMQEPN